MLREQLTWQLCRYAHRTMSRIHFLSSMRFKDLTGLSIYLFILLIVCLLQLVPVVLHALCLRQSKKNFSLVLYIYIYTKNLALLKM